MNDITITADLKIAMLSMFLITMIFLLSFYCLKSGSVVVLINCVITFEPVVHQIRLFQFDYICVCKCDFLRFTNCLSFYVRQLC